MHAIWPQAYKRDAHPQAVTLSDVSCLLMLMQTLSIASGLISVHPCPTHGTMLNNGGPLNGLQPTTHALLYLIASLALL